MAKFAWAKFPSGWMRPVDVVPEDGTPGQHFPLSELQWQRYAGTGIAALFVLMALSIKLNQSHKDKAFDLESKPSNTVAVTFDELRNMTGLARPSISKALDLLKGLGAIDITLVGRSNFYTLLGVESNTTSSWSQLPQGWLLAKDGSLKWKHLPRNRHVLNALKIYMLMLRMRSKNGTSAISYTAITRWTGTRREDIPTALGILFGKQFARISFDRDIRHSIGDNSQRYSVIGLDDTAWESDMEATSEFSQQTRVMRHPGPLGTGILGTGFTL